MSDDVTTTDEDGEDIARMAAQYYRASRDHSSPWRLEAKTSYDMAAGNQWDADDKEKMDAENRPAVTFNRIARTLNAIIGTQVSNRQETQFLPRELGDVQKNEILTSAAEWVREQCDAEDEESDAFEDMCITGMGWTETRLDYDTDPDGAVLIERIDPLQMYWDPAATKRNLSDAKWFMRIKEMARSDFMREWPNADFALSSDPWDNKTEDDGQPREHVYPQDAYKTQQANSQKGKAKVRVAQIQWSEKTPIYRVGPQAEEISAEAFQKIAPKLKQSGIKYVKQMKIKWRQAFVAGGAVLEDGDCPTPDGSTFRPMTYKRDRNVNLWYGIVRAMVDPQRFGNKFFSQILDILNKGAKGGIMVEKDAVDDMRKLENIWARPDSVVEFRPGALSGGKVQPKPLVNLPAGLDRLMTFSMDGVHEVTGINLELLGMANREQAGVLEHQRKQAGVTIIAPLFDGLRRYRKEQGRVLLHFIQAYLSDGRLIRIHGNDGTEQYAPLVKDPSVARYDVIVDESPTSPNMKERVFGTLSELLPTLAKMGIPMPPELLDYAPIPSSLAAKWKDLIGKSAGNPEQVQQQMQQMQQDMQKLGAENAQLKDKRQEAMLDLQLKQQQQQADMEIERQKMQLEIEKANAQIEIERAKLQLEREKAGIQIQIDQQKVANDNELAREKMNTELESKVAQSTDGVNEAIGRYFEKYRGAGKRKRLKVERDPQTGDLIGATIDEEDQAA